MPSNFRSSRRKAIETFALSMLRDEPRAVIGDYQVDVLIRQSILWALVWEEGHAGMAADRIGVSVRMIQQRLKDWGFTYIPKGAIK